MPTRPRVRGTVAKVMPLDSVVAIEISPLRQAAGALYAIWQVLWRPCCA